MVSIVRGGVLAVVATGLVLPSFGFVVTRTTTPTRRRGNSDLGEFSSTRKVVFSTSRRREDMVKVYQSVLDESTERKKRVLILMSDTGGGHRSSAQALAHALERLYPSKIEYEILDIWTEYAVWPYKKFVPWYAFVAKHPLMWRALWSYAQFPITRRLQEFSTRVQCYDNFEKAFRDRAPLDAVVSVHPLCQTLPLRVLRKLDAEERRPETPFVTVVTDLASAHPTWFHKDVDACFVPSDSVAKIALKLGLEKNKIKQHGLPLRHAFWEHEKRPKAHLRHNLALPENMETALLVGGGDGVGRIAALAKAIGHELGQESKKGFFSFKKKQTQTTTTTSSSSSDPTNPPEQKNKKKKQFSLVIVCGRNEDAQRDLEAYDWPDNVHATVLGFVKNMDEYMAAADCLITKAGPGTIAEASTRGLPTLISSYLPGQEFGNVKYVTDDKQFGVFRRRPKRVAKTIRNWLQDNHTRSQLAARALSAAQLDATTNIAKDIADYLGFQDEDIPEAAAHLEIKTDVDALRLDDSSTAQMA